ncbi:MAG: 50S ribosomal protein L24 [Hydrogenothermaceae bacterium]|nr:50S ribosomal protein L24 [Hydrogenothermaceae bacterium]
MLKLRKGDKVVVLSGKDKGEVGKIKAILRKNGKVRAIVEGVNIVKKHLKKIEGVREGGIFEVEKPVDISNLAYYDEKVGKPVKVGFKISLEGEKVVKYRINKKTGEIIDKVWEKIKKEV